MRLYHQRLATFYLGPRALELGLLDTRTGDYTHGVRCALQYPSTIIEGLEFVTPVAGSFKLSFWDLDKALARTKTVVCPSAGVYQAIFDDPYVVSLAEYQRQHVNGIDDVYWTFSIHEVTGNLWIRLTADWDTLWVPNVGGYVRQAGTGFLPNYTWPAQVACKSAGDSFPGDSGIGLDYFLAEPIMSYELESEAPPPAPGPWPCPPCTSVTPCLCDGYGSEEYGTCSGYGLENCAILGPGVDPETPADKQQYIPIDTNISFQITDDNAIVSSTFKIYVDRGDGTFDLAFDMEGIPQFQAGYDGLESSITDLAPGEYRSYEVVIDPIIDFDRATTIRVKVEAFDSAGNPARIV
jgi:hypothetical protein